MDVGRLMLVFLPFLVWGGRTADTRVIKKRRRLVQGLSHIVPLCSLLSWCHASLRETFVEPSALKLVLTAQPILPRRVVMQVRVMAVLVEPFLRSMSWIARPR